MAKKILIADDAPYIREIIRNILTDEDVIFVPDACDGEEAVKLAVQHQPDLIFMDLALPLQSGVAATTKILEQYNQVRIIAVSSLHEPHMIQKALEAGCCDFIKKPFSIEEIKQAIFKPEAATLEAANE